MARVLAGNIGVAKCGTGGVCRLLEHLVHTHKLDRLRVEKPWGRRDLWPGFEDVAAGGVPVGEVWFDDDSQVAEILVKYLFTSDRLSVQVHPGDAAARAAGYARGKDEAWLILAAEPDATIALGPKAPTSRDALKTAARNGNIVDLLDWRPVKAGDFIYSAAGVVHAIGKGITLIEIQQNVDLTYRLYDYGSDRELHLEAGIAVSDVHPFVAPPIPGDIGDGRTILCEGGKFVVERWSWASGRTVTLPEGVPGWLVPVTGGGGIDGARFAAGDCWTVAGETMIAPDAGSDLLFAYPLAHPAKLFG